MPSKDGRDDRELWQTLLESILQENPQVLKPLADSLGVSDASVRRWSKGETYPHNAEQTLRRMVRSKLLPEERLDAFIEAVQLQFPHFLEEPDLLEERSVKRIPQLFYSQVLDTNDFSGDQQAAFQTITDIVTQHLFSLLDEDKSAQLAVQLLLCTPPDSPDSSEETSVSSFYAPILQIGVRPSPLAANCPVFFGMESPLANLVLLLSGQKPYVFDEQAIAEFPFSTSIRSMALFPIQRRAKIAGCLIITSSASDYFTSERRMIVYELCKALPLAFDQVDFYAVQRIALANLPEISCQMARESHYHFNTRKQALRARLDEAGSRLNNQKLEVLAIQELERELIFLQRKQSREHIQENAPPVERRGKN